MFADLHIPFPQAQVINAPGGKKKEKGKGKAIALPTEERIVRTCWDGVVLKEREDVSDSVGMAGHLGYQLVCFTVAPATPGQIPVNPFLTGRPYPALDPRDSANAEASSSRHTGKKLLQLSRLNITLDDSTQHGMSASNTSLLSTYDILSCSPTTPSALQNACINLTAPGSNQINIITLPCHQNTKMPFYLKRSSVKVAMRNGAVFEIPYSAALSPPPTTPPEQARRLRQNFMTNAREAIRVVMAVSGGGGRDGSGKRGKGGGGIIFSSGSGGWAGMRGPADLVNLAVLLGMPANLAKAAVAETPRGVLLKAQARKTYKGVLSVPRMVQPAPAVVDAALAAVVAKTDNFKAASTAQSQKKRSATGEDSQGKRQKVKS